MAVAAPGLGPSMDARLDGIGHLLRDRLLAVPTYQRSYAWSREQVQQYVDDLQAALGSLEPTYFLGTVVLTQAKGDRLTIVDGQQRLATTVLLFAAIAAEFEEAGETSRASVIVSQYIASQSLQTNELQPRLVLNEEDQEVFAAVALRREGPAVERPAHRRILEAYELLRAAVRGEVERAGPHWQDILFRWVTFIDTQVQVIVVIADNDADAFLLFETLNDRGMDLSVVDLLKNHLFGLARPTLEEVQRPWVAAIEALDSEEDQTMTTFLRHYWSSINGPTRERELYRSLKRHIRSGEQAAEFARGLREAAPGYAALLDPDDDYWVSFDPQARDAAGILFTFGLEQNRPLLLAAMDAFPRDEFVLLLESLVSWSVRGVIVGGIGGGTTESYYANAAAAIRRGRLTNTADVLDSMRPIVPNDEAFASGFATATVYRIRTGLYLLLSLERDATGVARPGLMSADERGRFTAEAILPRASEPWPGWTADEVSALSRRLGNFALLPAGLGRMSGLPWEGRRTLLAESGLATNEIAAAQEEWLPESVRERQQAFAHRVAAIWPLMP